MKNIIILILAFGTILVNLPAQHNSDNLTKKDIPAYKIGDKIEDFNLPDIDGELVSLSQNENAKGHIIVFTSNICPFAVASEQRLIELNHKLAPKGYPVIAINSNIGEEENLQAMKKKVAEKEITFAYLKDNSNVYQKFGATKTPHVFLVDNTMTLRYKGSIDDSPSDPENVDEQFLADAVNDLINNRTPDPAVTKSIGCPIKRGDQALRKGPKGPPNPEALLNRMDTNKDGKISKNEAKGPIGADFNQIDLDNDGVLTAEELSKSNPGKRKSH